MLSYPQRLYPTFHRNTILSQKFLSRIHAQEVIRESYAIAELHRHERISARNDFEGHGDMSSSCRVGERGRPTYNIDPSWSNKSSPSWGSSSKQRGSLSAEDHMFRLLMLPIDMLSNSLLKIIGKLWNWSLPEECQSMNCFPTCAYVFLFQPELSCDTDESTRTCTP